jgi:predicted dehydrogenase
MDDGAIGTVEFALCHMASPWRSFLDPQMKVMKQWIPSLSAPDPRTWQRKETGGGYAHGQITHSAGLLFWLTGLRAAHVSCRMSAPRRDVDEYNAAHVQFTNGATGVVSGAANLVDDDPFQLDLRIFGSEGVLLLDVERERMEVRRHDGWKHTEVIAPGAGAYSCEGPPHRFIELIQGLGRNDSPGYIGAATVELIAAMFASAHAGCAPVEVSPRTPPVTRA